MNQSELRVMLAISVGKHHAFDAENFDFASHRGRKLFQ